MYKWQSAPAEVSYPMQTKVNDINEALQPTPTQPMSMLVLFEAPTGYLDKLHAHVTYLQVGAGYPAHTDEYDVAIVILSGIVETLGRKLGPGGTIFYAAGEPHGMRNAGDEPARYLVFEFHRSRLVETCIRAQRPRSSKAARQSVTEHAILVFGHTRPEALQFVLEGLRRQDALLDTQVWLDGHQEFPDLVPFVRACHALEASYPEARWYKYGSRCGFTKLFVDAVLLNCSRYKQLIILQDDCYPAPSAIDALLLSLSEIENDPRIFSVYGHHFGAPDEGPETSAFQAWGWASSSYKLQPVVTELSRLWNMPEPDALAWFRQNMTPEIRARMDVFPGRSESKLLDGRFCHDAAMAFLIARNGMSNKKTREHVIFNFGIGDRCWHFPTLLELYLKPPFNMIAQDELIKRFGLHDLPGDIELLARHGVPEVQGRLLRLDRQVQTLRAALATSEQDRADRLDVINRLDAHIDLLRTEIAARDHPWRMAVRALRRRFGMVCGR
jgi:quercetin dioxygenase-like cupin family protein